MGRKKKSALAALALGMGLLLTAATAPDAAVRDRDENCREISGRAQLLATILNTQNRGYDCLGVSVDAHADITAIRFEAHDPEAARVRVREFALDEIASNRGAVLDGVPGHDAVILQGEIVSGAPAARLVVRFLHNGLTGEFRECGVRLAREDSSWRLLDAESQPVPLVVIKTWALPLFGTVGIDTLEGICQG